LDNNPRFLLSETLSPQRTDGSFFQEENIQISKDFQFWSFGNFKEPEVFMKDPEKNMGSWAVLSFFD